MAKYKTEKRKANVGERILITNADYTFGDYENSDVFTVVDYFTEDAVLVNGEYIPQIYHREYEVIIADKPSKSERIALLESQVAELQAKVEALQKRRKPATVLVHSPNEQRKAVIERAKAFVKDTINDYQLSDSEISFVVDEKKRSVSVTLSHLFSGKALAKAIAKCAPDDVFNEYIGKAIALGRALGLDVNEFENAVKPTEVVVGMVAEIRGNIHPYIKTIISGDYGQFHSVEGMKRNKDRLLRILDDTKAEF